MHKSRTRFAFALLAAAASAPVMADPVCALGAGNVGITSLACSFDSVTNTITVRETFGNAGMGSIVFSGLDQSVNYTVRKIIFNDSGIDFSRIANELLDPAGDGNDATDPLNQPAFVPAGFSTSNDNDGLSFAQGSGLPRTSSVFPALTVDKLSDARDFLDFSGGLLLAGSTDNFMTFGLRDNTGANQPFLLVERPNQSSVSVPEPGALLLAGTALAGLLVGRRRRQR